MRAPAGIAPLPTGMPDNGRSVGRRPDLRTQESNDPDPARVAEGNGRSDRLVFTTECTECTEEPGLDSGGTVSMPPDYPS
jgi:hypothetical protein